MVFEYPVNQSGFVDLILYNNNITGNMFMPFVLLAFLVVCYMTLYQWGISKAFTSSIYVTGILAIMLRAAGLLTDFYMIIAIILMAIGSLWLYFEEG